MSAQRILAGSSLAQRVGKRTMSWLEPVHTGQRAAGSGASVCSTTPRSALGLELRVDEREVEREVAARRRRRRTGQQVGIEHVVSPTSRRGGS